MGLQWQENLLLVAWLLLNFEGIVSGTEKFHVYFQTDGNCLQWIEMSLPSVVSSNAQSEIPNPTKISKNFFYSNLCFSCGTVALYGLFINLFFLADHRATDFTLSKICGTPTKNTSHLSTVIFTTKRFVRVESCG